MKLHRAASPVIIGLLLLLCAVGCQSSGSSGRPEAIDPQQVTSSIAVYAITDHQMMLFDSTDLPLTVLHRFIAAWNSSEETEMRKFLPSFTIHIQFKDSSRRSFRLRGNYAKEQNDWSHSLGDTMLIQSLDSLRRVQEYWFGTYETENGATLDLHRNGRYHYFNNQCTYGYSSEGEWQNNGDTLHLLADPEPNDRVGAAADGFQWASFEEPFVRKGQVLYFTVDGDLNYHYFFTKE